MKICVFGAGAVGGNLAARLARAGEEVSVVARGATLEAIRSGGITVEAGSERINQRVRATDRPGDLGAQDVVISTLKAGSLPALAAGIAPLLGPDTLVAFVQNGIPWWYSLGMPQTSVQTPDLSSLDPGGALSRIVPLRSIIGAVIYSANTVVAPAVIQNGAPEQNRISLATIDGSDDPRLAALRQRMDKAAIKAPVVTDIRQEIWQKLLSNLLTGMTILVDEPTSTMMADREMVKVAERFAREVVAIAAAHSIVIKPAMPNVPVGKKASILQDYEARRPMEVAAQYLAPLAFAHAAGVAAPTLEAVATLIAHKAAARNLFTR